MDLEGITTVVRPRGAWEATDLGLVMARAWWWPLARVWLLVSLPLFLVLEVVLYRYPMMALLIIWWLKPLWERPLLHILSQAFFGRMPTLRETLRAFPAQAGRQWFASLTYRRLSPTRSMDLPVVQLENLKGGPRARRLSVLHRTATSGAGWLTVVGVHIEALLSLAVLVFMGVMLTPAGSDWNGAEMLFDQPLLAQHVYAWLTYGCMWLVAPFYAAAGFSLYLNRRIWLEGWDIEISFRRLRQRLAGQRRGRAAAAVVALLCGALLAVVPGEQVWADERLSERDAVKAAIEHIMAHEDFNQQRTIHRLKGWESSGEEAVKPPPQWLRDTAAVVAESSRLLLWVAVVIAVIIVVMRYRHWLTYYTVSRRQGDAPAAMPASLFGLALGRESLPTDVVGRVRALWRQGDVRAALALLYRASLTVLMERDQYPFSDALTEGECLGVVTAAAPGELSEYFAELTHHWLMLAYGHRIPDGEAVEALCQRWPRLFGDPAVAWDENR